MPAMTLKSVTMSSSFAHPDIYEGHRVLPVRFNDDYPAAHQIFFRPHKVKDPCESKPNLRTLFVSNVPPWATPASIRRVFQANGPIETVAFQRTPTAGPPPPQETTTSSFPSFQLDTRVGSGFKFAYVVFERQSGVYNAMNKMDVSQPRVLSSASDPIEVGMGKWRREYNASVCTDAEGLGRAIEEGVAEMDLVKEEGRRKAVEQMEEADEDGWVTVSRHTARKPVGKLTDKAQAKVKARESRKRKRKELENFYRHQMKEKKLVKLTELKEKFEADKKRQLLMKQGRKFKPV